MPIVSSNITRQEFEELKERTEVLQYLLGQTLTLAARSTDDPKGTLDELEAFFRRKGGDKRSEFGENLLSAVRASL